MPQCKMKGAICQKGKYNTEELNKERKLKDLKEITNEEDELRLDEEAGNPDTTVIMENPSTVMKHQTSGIQSIQTIFSQ